MQYIGQEQSGGKQAEGKTFKVKMKLNIRKLAKALLRYIHQAVCLHAKDEVEPLPRSIYNTNSEWTEA